MGVLVIAEPGMTWDRDLSKAFRLIDAAKACGADVCKFQWTSSGAKLAERRQMPTYKCIYERGVQYPREWLLQLHDHCNNVGIEFACTTYLLEDIEVVTPLVRRMKVSAYESGWMDFLVANMTTGLPVVASIKPHVVAKVSGGDCHLAWLHCVSEYPAAIEKMELKFHMKVRDGLSDHTTSTLTGALAVAAGATIVEKHILLCNTNPDNPDFKHSLTADYNGIPGEGLFASYVANIREAEKAL